MIRVVVADDYPVVREGLKRILSLPGDIGIVAEAADGRELLARARRTKHDLVLLDVSMPGPDWLDVLKQLKRERPKVPVVILTMSSADQFAVRALRAGASGYVLKEAAPAELVSAVRKVAGGGRYVTGRVAETLAEHVARETEAPRHEDLSDREYQVMRMIAAGKSTRQIAADLGLSVKTIGTYRTRIFEKMRMTSPAEVAAYVVRSHLADEPLT